MARHLVDLVPGVAAIGTLGAGFVALCFNESILVSPPKTWWNGDWGVAYEDALDEEFAVREPSVGAWGVIEYALFGDGRRGVVVGEGGWLFTAEEFEVYPGAMERAAERADRVARVRAGMEARGVGLVVVFLPAKSRIEAAHLGGQRVPAQAAEVGPHFAQRVRAAGVELVDLEPVLREARGGGEVFLRTDTHWTPRGADAAALAVATRVRELGADWVDGAQVTVSEAPPVEHAGDLLRYLPLGPLQARLGPANDSLATPTAAVEAQGGLLGDVSIPAALVGTSYSEDRRWGFVASLQRHLGADVLNAATQGKGPFVAMDTYLADKAWTDAPPRLVIWEIPERYVAVPDTP
jgi:alginate O-acetyltransferase complex protein AlgJ